MTREMIENRGILKQIFQDFKLTHELLIAWREGVYKIVPYGSIIFGLGALAYFFSPIDLVPDFIFIFGFIDDAFVMGLVLNQIHRDLKAFEQWKLKQALPGEP